MNPLPLFSTSRIRLPPLRMCSTAWACVIPAVDSPLISTSWSLTCHSVLAWKSHHPHKRVVGVCQVFPKASPYIFKLLVTNVESYSRTGSCHCNSDGGKKTTFNQCSHLWPSRVCKAVLDRKGSCSFTASQQSCWSRLWSLNKDSLYIFVRFSAGYEIFVCIKYSQLYLQRAQTVLLIAKLF